MAQSNPPKLGPTVGKAETEAGRIRDEYASHKFYISSTDKHHNSERVRTSDQATIRVPPFVWALIAKWVDDERTPYRTAQDLIRDAVVHRLHQLQELSESIPDATWRGMRLQAEMARRASEASRYKESIVQIREMMQTAWNDGDLDLYAELTKDAEHLVKEIPEPYSSMLKEFLTSQKSLRKLKNNDT